MKIKFLLKLLIFTALYLLLNDRVTEVFSPKSFLDIPNLNQIVDKNWLSTMHGGFYSEKKDSIDVVFIGSSQVFCDINPNLIWNEYGITTYNFAAHRQEPGTSYYYLRQMFETQSPKVVVVDFYMNGVEKLDADEKSAAHYNFDFMKKDLIRAQAIWDRTGENRLETYFPIILYNQRWKELSKDDLLFQPVRHDFLKGSFLYMDENHWEGSFRNPDEALPEYILPDETIHWLNAIQQLCEEHDCECLFMKTPVVISGYDKFSKMSETEFYAYIEALSKYCNEHNMAFLDTNKYIQDMGLNYKNDFVDNIHLNWNGQQKFSAFLGKYLQETYHLENQKGRPGFEQWDADYEQLIFYTDNFWELHNKLEEEYKKN